MNNYQNINKILKKKILNNFQNNKKNFFADANKTYFYKDIYKRFLSIKKIIEQKDLKEKKILAVIYNKSGLIFWVNFLVTFMLDLTVMPLEKDNKNYKKIEKYFDGIIIFDGLGHKIKKNSNIIINKVITKTEYISSTSGSTGNPKMILHKFDSIIKGSIETSNRLKYKKNKNFLIAIPNFYNSAVCHFFTCLIKCMNFYSLEEFMYPKNLNYHIRKYKINYFGGAPLQAEWIIGDNLKNKTNLEKIVSSGDFLKNSTISLFLDKKTRVHLYNIYGITEAGGRVFINDVKNSKDPFSLGKPLKHFNIVHKRVSKNIFEIGIKSKYIFLGYYSDRFSQINKLNKAYLTNDLAYKINGNYKLQGRKNEIFKSSGIKIFPEFIKNEILKIKGISNAFVFSKHFDLIGNVPVVAYEGKKKFDEAFIFKELSKTLQKKQIPLEYKYYIKFPYLKNKKINKLKIKNEM